MAGPKVVEDETNNETNDESQGKAKKIVGICPFCERKGHKTMTARSCLFSMKVGSPNYEEDNEERGLGK
jgi:hypothetical protein